MRKLLKKYITENNIDYFITDKNEVMRNGDISAYKEAFNYNVITELDGGCLLLSEGYLNEDIFSIEMECKVYPSGIKRIYYK